MDTILNVFYKSKENTVCLLAWYCMRASKTFFTEYYGAENFTWLESVMSRTIGSTMVYRGETLECSKWEKEEGIRSRSFRLCRKLTLLDIFYLFPSLWRTFIPTFIPRWKKGKISGWGILGIDGWVEALSYFSGLLLQLRNDEGARRRILPSSHSAKW